MSRPYFSTIICNYNYGRFLRQGLESLLAQDFPAAEREIVVVDDGSTDDSIAVVESFKDKVRLFRQKNQKQAGAFKTGYAEAKGEIFCLLDADDFCEPGKLTAFAKAFEDPAIGLVQHYLRDVDENGRPLANTLPRWPETYSLEDYLEGRCEDAATSGLAFRRDVLAKALPVPPQIFCWYDEFLISHALMHAKMANIPRVLGYHRIHGANNWAHRLGQPDKMEGYVEQGRLFFSHFEAALEPSGRALSPRFQAALDTDFSRSLILAAIYKGDRARAWELWHALPSGSAGARFRSAMLSLALIHPGLYLSLYKFYENNPALRKAREALISG